MLIVLIAFGGLIQHGEMAASAAMPGHHISNMSAEKVTADTQSHGKRHQATDAGMADACAIICLGTATPWITAVQLVPTMSAHSLAWPFTNTLHEGRRIGPGFRPPRSI